jgi:hypothetical protein
MSSYHTSFSYLGKSSKDMGWIIVAFDADEGATDSYLSQEQIYTDSYNGTRRILYFFAFSQNSSAFNWGALTNK